LTAKTAKTAFTPLDKVFMVPSDAILDSDLCAQILKMGHSRVPVHAPGDRTQIMGILLVKELLMVKVCSVSACGVVSMR
jgi:metal transporter CNNM